MTVKVVSMSHADAFVIEPILDSVSNNSGEQLLDLRVGAYWTMVQTSVGAGMASTMAGEAHPHKGMPISNAGTLHDLIPTQLTKLLRSSSPPEAAVGLAAVNALVDLPDEGVGDENARDLLLDRGQGQLVAIIGHFPFVDVLRKSCRELWVFEKGRGQCPGDLGSEHVAELLPHADVVAISATTLINHTIDEILPHIRAEAFTIMLGPSTPMVPCLFDFDFDVLCGTIIEEPERVFRAVEQGAVTKQIGGVRRVSLTRR